MDLVAPALLQASDLQQRLGQPVLAMLPIESSVLRLNASALLDAVEQSDVQVGLALGHTADPLGAQGAVRGLIPLARTGRVHLRRSDLSAVGALALNAPSAAMASTATLRHIYPSTKGGMPSEYPAVLVPRVMTWKRQDLLIDIASRFPREDVWACDCTQCGGGGVHWAVESVADVMRHNFFVAAALATAVTTSPDPVATWFAHCKAAQHYLWEVDSAISEEWQPPAFLGAWIANEPSLAGQ